MVNNISLLTRSGIYELSKPMCHIMPLTIIEPGNPHQGCILLYITKHLHISDKEHFGKHNS